MANNNPKYWELRSSIKEILHSFKRFKHWINLDYNYVFNLPELTEVRLGEILVADFIILVVIYETLHPQQQFFTLCDRKNWISKLLEEL